VTPLTFGHVVVAVSIIVVLASIALGVRPDVGTVANAILVGVFTDVFLGWQLLDGLANAPALLRLLVTVLGTAAIALGTALYIGAKLGAGPRDALMLGAAQRFRRSPGAARVVIETGVLAVGIMLGGSVGVGTIAFIVLIGPAINASFRLLGMDPPKRRPTASHQHLARAARSWARRGQLGSSASVEASRGTGGRI
jgi:uncharacterized membrane protein YczE